MAFNVVSIHGAPRSGTSWLGQIFDSHPEVAYRHQPLFSYRFKDRIHLGSTRADIHRFLQELFAVTDDDFLLDVSRRKAAAHFWQTAVKRENPRFLVMKMVRYHHLLELFLDNVADLKIIGIVRHPCGVINSWLQAPREFLPAWSARDEWRQANQKNAGRAEEFYGFEKWKEVARLFAHLERTRPDRFCLVHYERLVREPEAESRRLFEFAGLTPGQQTIDFIRLTHSRSDPDPYAVFKDPEKHRRWETELDPEIARAILEDVQHTDLERFVV